MTHVSCKSRHCYDTYLPIYRSRQQRNIQTKTLNAFFGQLCARLASPTTGTSPYPQLYIFHVATHPQFPWYTQCVDFGSYPSDAWQEAKLILDAALLFFIPLAVIIVTYTVILVTINNNRRMCAGGGGGGGGGKDGDVRFVKTYTHDTVHSLSHY